MTQTRYYSSSAKKTILQSPVDAGDTILLVLAVSDFPPNYPYTLILDRDTLDEEVVEATGATGTSFTVTRGVDGTTAVAHSSGSSVEHGTSARDFQESDQHRSTSENVHGIDLGSLVVGTIDVQTLTNKTLGSNLAAGGFKVTGLANPTSAQDAATKNWSETSMTAQVAQATTQATNAATSASTASTQAGIATTQAGIATTQATNSSSSASAASGSASAASGSASTATSAASTATTQAGIATTQAGIATTQAGISTTQAGTSTTQATNASTSASTALTQAGVATTQAGISTTQATNSASSASAASTSASGAASSASAASGSATTASTGASTATTQAGISTTQSGVSTTQAGIATTQAGIATAQAVIATTQAANSATSASGSASSASAAASSAAAAAASFDQFDDRYLGSKATAPTVDNDGNPLVPGALYYNTTTAEMYVYDGAAWLAVNAGTFISETIIDAKGDLIAGSAADTPARVAVGTNGYVLTADSAEAAGVKWALAAAGATGGGTDQVFYENDDDVSVSYTISSGKNAGTFGPVSIGSGATVEIPSGSVWTIV